MLGFLSQKKKLQKEIDRLNEVPSGEAATPGKNSHRFEVGRGAWLKVERVPITIIKIKTSSSTEAFYTIDNGGIISEGPESFLSTLSELVVSDACAHHSTHVDTGIGSARASH